MENNAGTEQLNIGAVSECAILPSIGQIVVAKVKFTRNWPECLGGLKITFKDILVMRIKTQSNSKGWQWSGVGCETYINGDVISWH